MSRPLMRDPHTRVVWALMRYHHRWVVLKGRTLSENPQMLVALRSMTWAVEETSVVSQISSPSSRSNCQANTATRKRSMVRYITINSPKLGRQWQL